MSAILVTGFVPDAYPAKHLSASECRDLGDRLADAAGDRLVAYEDPWLGCWAADLVRRHRVRLPSSRFLPTDRFESPEDYVRSNVVLLQRFQWLARAAAAHPEADTLAWVEWTVLKQNGVTPEVIRQFVADLDRHPCRGIAAPGCWPMSPIDDGEAHWRFVGSCLVVDRTCVHPLLTAIQTVASLRIALTGKISWDMNTLAYVELLGVLPFRWYAANHDETQFTRYAADL